VQKGRSGGEQLAVRMSCRAGFGGDGCYSFDLSMQLISVAFIHWPRRSVGKLSLFFHLPNGHENQLDSAASSPVDWHFLSVQSNMQESWSVKEDNLVVNCTLSDLAILFMKETRQKYWIVYHSTLQNFLRMELGISNSIMQAR
jgi:hypothetical protein